jgi:hypothetical protein
MCTTMRQIVSLALACLLMTEKVESAEIVLCKFVHLLLESFYVISNSIFFA